MQRRFKRLGAWISSLTILLATYSSPLAPLAAAADDNPAETAKIMTESLVLINELMPNPSTGSEFVELYNAGSQPVNLNGWTLSDENSVRTTFTETLNPGDFLVKTYSNVFNNTGDSAILKDASGAVRDEISYGDRSSDDIMAPAQGKSIARVPDGSTVAITTQTTTSAWYSGLTPSPGSTNDSPAVPALPTGAQVKAGASNPANVINLTNRAAVAVDVTLGSGSQAADTVTVQLLDSAGTMKSNSTAGSAGSGTVTVSPIDTTTTTSFVDGSITVRSYVTNSAGVSTAYVAGTTANRDTIAPADPTAASVLAGASNDANVINSSNVAAVSVSVTLPATSVSSDTVKVELSDGTTTVSATAPAPSGGGTISLTNFRILALDARTLTDGSIAVKATAIDAAGNASNTLTGAEALKDTTPPAGSVDINAGATVTNTNAVSLTLTTSDVGSGVKMRLANTNDFKDAAWEDFTASKAWTLLSGDGLRTVYLQIRDAAGNISATAEKTILVESDAENISRFSLATGTQTVRQLPLEATVTATSVTTLTFARFRTNPGTNVPGGTTSLGSFYEVGVAEASKLTFPVLLKIYYTTADLAAAGITSESQLQGIAFFDQATQTWKYFASTGVVTSDVVVDGQNFAGYLFANADHLTPIVALADTTPPVAPAKLDVTAGNGFIDLSWTPSSSIDATNYVVRYRLVSDPPDAYTEVVLPATTTKTRIMNLENGRRYEFGVATRDAAGNTSNFITVFAEPVAPLPPASAKTAVRIGALIPSAQAATPAAPTTPTPEATAPGASITPTTSPERTRDLSRLLITLAILIIAIGAGTAGYYGYQWWATRPTGPGGPPPISSGTPPPESSKSPVSSPSAAPKPPESSEPPATPPKPPQSPPTGRW